MSLRPVASATTIFALACALLLAVLVGGCGRSGGPVVHTREIFSQPYHVDQKYRSMVGPKSTESVKLVEGEPELLWIVGYDSYVVEADSLDSMSQEFMCHANLDLDQRDYLADFPTQLAVSGRLFTLSQGQQEIRFPKGFGIPFMSDQDLRLTTQVLNLNLDSADLDVRHRVKIHYVRDAELEKPMRALFMVGVEGLKAVDESCSFFGMRQGDPELSCGLGVNADPEGILLSDHLSQQFIGHWVVKPGVEVNKTVVTRRLNLAFDTTVHYVAVHLHPTAESLELVDLTEDRLVFRAGVTPVEEGLGIREVEHYSSKEGFALHKDHEYAVISRYNNTTGQDVDSMAVFYMYLEDPFFRKPGSGGVDAVERALEVPRYPGATLLEGWRDTGQQTRSDGTVSTASYKTQDSVAQVLLFYRSTLAGSEWQGPEEVREGGFWWLGLPAAKSLDFHVEPAEAAQPAGLLWVWRQGGTTFIRGSRYRPR